MNTLANYVGGCGMLLSNTDDMIMFRGSSATCGFHMFEPMVEELWIFKETHANIQ